MANPRLRKELLETVRGLHAADAIDFKKLQEFETFRVRRVVEPEARPFSRTQRPARTSMNRRRPASR